MAKVGDETYKREEPVPCPRCGGPASPGKIAMDSLCGSCVTLRDALAQKAGRLERCGKTTAEERAKVLRDLERRYPWLPKPVHNLKWSTCKTCGDAFPICHRYDDVSGRYVVHDNVRSEEECDACVSVRRLLVQFAERKAASTRSPVLAAGKQEGDAF